MSNDRLKDFILSHAEEINNNDFKSVYSKALGYYDPTSVIPRFTEILIDASINPLLYMDYVPPCYAYRLNWTSVVIPNTIKDIGNSAFEGCTRLTSVKMPNSVTSIGYYAFYNCTGLTNITLPDSMTHIHPRAFGGCTALESIKIPDSVTSIGNGVFYDCRSLTSVTIGNSVTSIDSSAFWGCRGLTSITIPESVTSIGSYIFENCKNLKDITFKGTTEQWREAEKAANMGLGVAEGTKIVCKDGEIIK